MIPKARLWRVKFFKSDGRWDSTVVRCVKRFAVSYANELLGYPAYDSVKVTVGLVKE